MALLKPDDAPDALTLGYADAIRALPAAEPEEPFREKPHSAFINGFSRKKGVHLHQNDREDWSVCSSAGATHPRPARLHAGPSRRRHPARAAAPNRRKGGARLRRLVRVRAGGPRRNARAGGHAPPRRAAGRARVAPPRAGATAAVGSRARRAEPAPRPPPGGVCESHGAGHRSGAPRRRRARRAPRARSDLGDRRSALRRHPAAGGARAGVVARRRPAVLDRRRRLRAGAGRSCLSRDPQRAPRGRAPRLARRSRAARDPAFGGARREPVRPRARRPRRSPRLREPAARRAARHPPRADPRHDLRGSLRAPRITGAARRRRGARELPQGAVEPDRDEPRRPRAGPAPGARAAPLVDARVHRDRGPTSGGSPSTSMSRPTASSIASGRSFSLWPRTSCARR